LPYDDRSFDAVLFVDVLHHADDPARLLAEGVRTARRFVIIKDHCQNGVAAGPTLRFMDWVGNARHGVARPGVYWPESRWKEVFSVLGLTVSDWTPEVPLYPWWASWLFGRSLHFVARLSKNHG
jgi:SAM-dependent methyltransferase